MTVRELIEELKKMDQDAGVVLWDHTWQQYEAVDSVSDTGTGEVTIW